MVNIILFLLREFAECKKKNEPSTDIPPKRLDAPFLVVTANVSPRENYTYDTAKVVLTVGYRTKKKKKKLSNDDIRRFFVIRNYDVRFLYNVVLLAYFTMVCVHTQRSLMTA
ncbi:hypothetical protein PGB90_001547 [Kerria lacca]